MPLGAANWKMVHPDRRKGTISTRQQQKTWIVGALSEDVGVVNNQLSVLAGQTVRRRYFLF